MVTRRDGPTASGRQEESDQQESRAGCAARRAERVDEQPHRWRPSGRRPPRRPTRERRRPGSNRRGSAPAARTTVPSATPAGDDGLVGDHGGHAAMAGVTLRASRTDGDQGEEHQRPAPTTTAAPTRRQAGPVARRPPSAATTATRSAASACASVAASQALTTNSTTRCPSAIVRADVPALRVEHQHGGGEGGDRGRPALAAQRGGEGEPDRRRGHSRSTRSTDRALAQPLPGARGRRRHRPP